MGAPNSPPRNRKASRVCIFGASVHPMLERTNKDSVIRMMGSLPNISENGAKSNGPIANPRRKNDTAEVDASWELW